MYSVGSLACRRAEWWLLPHGGYRDKWSLLRHQTPLPFLARRLTEAGSLSTHIGELYLFINLFKISPSHFRLFDKGAVLTPTQWLFRSTALTLAGRVLVCGG